MHTHWRTMLFLTFLLPIVFMSSPEAAIAQVVPDCGTLCKECGAGGTYKEGYSYHAEGEYWMNCYPSETGCNRTGCSESSLVGDVAPGAEEVLVKVKSAPVHSLSAIAETLRGRLVVYPERNLVAVRGGSCAPNSIIGVAFLSPERISVLTKAGLPRLETVLEEADRQVRAASTALPQATQAAKARTKA